MKKYAKNLGLLLISGVLAGGFVAGAAPASATAAAPQIKIVPGASFQTGSTQVPVDLDHVVPYTARWTVSAPGGICAESARVDDGYGATLASFDDRTAPFPTQLSYRSHPWGAYSNGDAPPNLVVTVTDCAGNSDTASVNLAVRSDEEDRATFSAGWVAGTCDCWSLRSARKSTGAGQTATYTSTFNGIALLSDRGPGRGTADIYLDGKFVRSLDAAAPVTTNRLIIWQTHFATKARHTLQVRVTSGRFDVDAFLTTYDLSGWGNPA